MGAACQPNRPAADRRRPADPAGALARHRSHVQAGERSPHPRQDQRRREGQGRRSGAGLFARGAADLHRRHRSATRSTRRRGKRACGGFPRRSPRIRWCFAATSRCRSTPAIATTPTAKARRSPPARSQCRLFIQAVTKADDGMELPLYESYFATSPSGLPDEKQLIADVREHDRPAGRACARRRSSIRTPGRRFSRAAPRASSSTRSSATASKAIRQRNADDGQTFGSKVNQPVLPAFLSVVFDPTLKKLRQHRADGPLPVRRRGRQRRAA